MDDYKIIVEQEHQTVMAQLSEYEKQYEYCLNKLLIF